MRLSFNLDGLKLRLLRKIMQTVYVNGHAIGVSIYCSRDRDYCCYSHKTFGPGHCCTAFCLFGGIIVYVNKPHVDVNDRSSHLSILGVIEAYISLN